MDVFSWVPHQSTQLSVTTRTLKAQFGSGYTQEVADGINPIIRNWQLVFNNLYSSLGTVSTAPTLAEVNTFLEAHVGVRFLWVQPTPFDSEGQKVFRAREWSIQYDGGKLSSLQVVFERQPDV
jgi:phage-related protein